MKQFTVYFSAPVAYTFKEERRNRQTRKLEEVEVTEMTDVVTLHSLSSAKKLIRENWDKYKGSCITKIWANGDWENLGEINIKGANRTFVANTRQRKANY